MREDFCIIDGKKVANKLAIVIRDMVKKINLDYGITPILSVILLGDDKASVVYIRNKKKYAKSLGIDVKVINLDYDTTEYELLSVIEELNNDICINGILVQLPLPKHIKCKKYNDKYKFKKRC